VLKSRRLRFVGHVTRMEEIRGQLGCLGVDGKIILKRILKRQNGKVWTGFNWLRIGFSGGLL